MARTFSSRELTADVNGRQKAVLLQGLSNCSRSVAAESVPCVFRTKRANGSPTPATNRRNTWRRPSTPRNSRPRSTVIKTRFSFRASAITFALLSPIRLSAFSRKRDNRSVHQRPPAVNDDMQLTIEVNGLQSAVLLQDFADRSHFFAADGSCVCNPSV